MDATVAAAEALSGAYQATLQHEVDALTATQGTLHARMADADAFAAQVLRATRARSQTLTGDMAGLRGGKAVDAVAEAAEETFTLLTSVVSTLLAIDEMLPAQDRLGVEGSAHRRHYPRLHGLLGGKRREVEGCFSHRGGGEGSANRPLPLRRRLSSSSQILLSGGSMGGERPRPPQLQLKTILPSGEEETKIVDSAKGAYFPIAPQTATGVSLTHSAGRSWEGRTRTEPEVESGDSISNVGARVSWGRRASGNWSALWGRSSRSGSAKDGGVEERLKSMLGASLADTAKGKGKGRRV